MRLGPAIRRWGGGWLRRRRGAAPAAPASAAVPDGDAARLDALLAARQVQRYEIERWRAAFAALPEPCVLLNQAGRVIFANREATRLLGLAGRESAGAAFEDLLRQGPEMRLWREPLLDGRNAEFGELVVLGDPSDDARNDQVLGEFLSHISHELKSPLNTIRSYAEMLLEGNVDRAETRKEFFNVITEESCRLAKLIDNLLDLAKLDRGALAPQRARLRLDSLVLELVRACEPQARAKGIQLAARVPPNLPSAFADKDLVGVAVSNLLANALKYTPDGGHVQVRLNHDEGTICIEVEDSGIGIPPEDRERVFEKFYRGASAEVRKQSGTGLGLALARQIVILHGGTLAVDSAPGRGSTFRIVLPVGGREQREAFGLPEAT